MIHPLSDFDQIYKNNIIYTYIFLCVLDTYKHSFTTGNEEAKTAKCKQFLGAFKIKIQDIVLCTN